MSPHPPRTGRPGPLRRRATAPLAAAAAAGLALLGLAGCADPVGGPVEPIELELVAWVAPGTRSVPEAVLGAATDLLVDRHEVTRGQWLTWGEAEVPDWLGPWAPATHAWPAVGMDLDEARAFARSRGMRLLRPSEWLWCAAGPRGQQYPYGPIPRVGVANTSDLGLGRPAPVGTFASGRTPGTGLADLLGNVWEWTEPEPRAAGPGAPRGFVSLQGALALGGSFYWRARPLMEEGAPFALDLDPGHRADDLGLRCCAPAEAWLRERAGEFDDPALRARVEAVGERWGPAAAPTLERLAGEPGAARCLGWLLAGARR